MSADAPIDPQLAAEVLAHVAWMRGAGGRWLPASEPAPKVRAPAPRGQGSPRGSSRARPQGGEDPEPAVQAGSAALQTSQPAARAKLDPSQRIERLEALAAQVEACTRCLLAGTRRQAVPGEGSPTARLVVVGEAPGAEEDATGRPFVGAAGKLLTKMLSAIGLRREDVYILNVLKCRPPNNRGPRPDEVAACRPYLREQLEILQPELILSLGSPASRELLRTERGIMSLRGRFTKTPEGWRVMPSYHPAYLLRRPEAKRDAWADLQKVAKALDLAIPPR